MSAKIRLFGTDTRRGDLSEDGERFSRYSDAIRVGQQRYGYGCFMVDTGNRVPSRSEQLLQKKGDSETARRKRILDTL